MASNFEALGVEFSLEPVLHSDLLLGIQVQNTKTRVLELNALIDKILEAGCLKRHEAATLRGRIAFCESQLWSRVGGAAMAALDEAALNGGRTQSHRLRTAHRAAIA